MAIRLPDLGPNPYAIPYTPPKPEDLKPKEEFSWNEFLKGVFQGLVGGAKVGTDLYSAREQAKLNRIKFAEDNADLIIDKYGGGSGSPSTSGSSSINAGGLSDTGNYLDILNPNAGDEGVRAGIANQLPIAGDLPSRQQARQVYAQSPGATMNEDEDIQEMLRHAEKMKQRKEKQLSAGDFQEQAKKYINAVTNYQAAKANYEAVKRRQDALMDDGYTDAAFALEAQLARLKSESIEKNNITNGLIRLLKERWKLSPVDLSALDSAPDPDRLIEELSKQKFGTTIRRQPGSPSPVR